MRSIAIFRHMRLRPAIGAGRLASGRSASMKSGCASPHTHACIPPIDVPITRRRCVTPRLSVSSRYCARTMSSYV